MGELGLVGTAFTFLKCGQQTFFVLFLVLFVFIGVGCALRVGKHQSPAWTYNVFAGDFEGDAVHVGHDGGSGKAAVGVEDGDEASGHEIKHTLFGVGEVGARLAGGYDGVVVGHF